MPGRDHSFVVWLCVLVSVCHGYSLAPAKVCPAIGCTVYCPNGNVLDRNGCETCTCKPDTWHLTTTFPGRRCLRLCRNYCPFGREMDADGCPTCRCVGGRGTVPPPPFVGRLLTPAPCRRVLCRNYCRNGRRLDNNGCETCRCNFDRRADVAPRSVRCLPLLCENYCPAGRVLDSNGCHTCACRSGAAPSTDPGFRPPCPPLLCKNYCYRGRVQDSDGCDTCRCKSDYSVRSWSTSAGGSDYIRRPALVRCLEVKCSNNCRDGRWAVDGNGCATCQCQRHTYRQLG